MKPLVIALAASLVLAVAACGGSDGARSAGPAPSVSVETAPPATSRGGTVNPGTDSYAHFVEYVNQTDAICKTATDKLEAALAELQGADLSATDLYGPRDEIRRLHEAGFVDLAFELSEEALVQLRALPPPEFGAVNPVALCSHRGGSQESASGPTRAEFIAQANEICRAADSRAQTNPEWYLPEGYESTARIMEEALAQLRALPQPEADRALLEVGFYQVVEQEIYAFREGLAALAAGDIARGFLLGYERVHLTHQKHAFTGVYGLRDCLVMGGA